MERAVNELTKAFRLVVVDGCCLNVPPIRFRADLVRANVYFSKVASQVTLWQNNGGVIVRWSRKHEVGDYDAILYVECPRSIEQLDRHARGAQHVCVVYEPPTWRVHFETAARRYARRPESKRRTIMDGIERMRQFLNYSDRFTPACLDRLLLAHQESKSLRSSARGSPEGAGRSAGTGSGAP